MTFLFIFLDTAQETAQGHHEESVDASATTTPLGGLDYNGCCNTASIFHSIFGGDEEDCVEISWIGDGYCDDQTNIAECDYDGGDCCGPDININWCIQCQCLSDTTTTTTATTNNVESYFEISGDVSLTKNNLANTFYNWGMEFLISFDIEVFITEPNGWVTNVLHMTTGEEFGAYGNRIPALFVTIQEFEFRSSVNGNHDHGFDFSYELNTSYHIVISQIKIDDDFVYSISIDNNTVHSVINTEPKKFATTKVYLSSPWLGTFGDYGQVKNLWVAQGEFVHILPGKYFQLYDDPT